MLRSHLVVLLLACRGGLFVRWLRVRGLPSRSTHNVIRLRAATTFYRSKPSFEIVLLETLERRTISSTKLVNGLSVFSRQLPY